MTTLLCLRVATMTITHVAPLLSTTVTHATHLRLWTIATLLPLLWILTVAILRRLWLIVATEGWARLTLAMLRPRWLPLARELLLGTVTTTSVLHLGMHYRCFAPWSRSYGSSATMNLVVGALSPLRYLLQVATTMLHLRPGTVATGSPVHRLCPRTFLTPS